MERNTSDRGKTENKKDGKGKSASPPFSLYGKITVIYLSSNLLSVTTDTVLEPYVGYSEYGSPPYSYLLYQVLLTIAVAILYYRVTKRARSGSIRASLITSGFLCYFVYFSLYSFSHFYSNLSIRLFFPIILTGALFILSSIDLYNYYVPRDPMEVKDRFPGNREHLAPGWFLILLVPIISLISILKSAVDSAVYKESFLYMLPRFHIPTDIERIGRFIGNYFETSPSIPSEIDAFVTIPLCFFAGVLLLKKRPTGYVLAPIFLVLISIRTLYIGKIIPFIIEIIREFVDYEEIYPGHRDFIVNGPIIPELKVILMGNISWFLKFIPSFAALVIVYYFLKSMKAGVPAAEEVGPKARKAQGRTT